MSEPVHCEKCGMLKENLCACSNPDCEDFNEGGHIIEGPRYEYLDAVLHELDRAQAKFPTWPTDPLHAFGVVAEEFGEVAKEVVQLTYEPHKSSPEALRKEAIQLAAMALRFCMSLDRYQHKPGEQHSQR